MEGNKSNDQVIDLFILVVNGYLLLHSIGYFLEPTVFTDVKDEMYIAIEESFGPIMIISTFENG